MSTSSGKFQTERSASKSGPVDQKSRAVQRALRIAGIYAVCGFLWIALSDRVLAAFITDSALLTRLQTFKGWLFICITAALVFFLTRRALLESERLAVNVRQSEMRYRALFENVNVIALIIEPSNGAILDANETAVEFYGWPRERLREMKIFQINTLPADEIRARMEEVKQRDGGTLLFSHRRADGSVRDVEVLSGSIPFEGRTVLYSTIHDVTERRRAEEEVRENRARLDLALQSAHMGVWRFEIKENRRHFDDLCCQLLGIDSAKFTGSSEEFFNAVHPEDRERVKTLLARTIERNAPYEPEYRVVWPDGTVRHIAARGRLVRDSTGKPARINGILWDVTEERLMEDERLKVQKLESLGTLAGGIAHDFNNLLQGVFGFISMAKLTHNQKEKSLAMLEQAEKALHQSVNLTSQLLTFSRGGKPVKKTISLRPVIENAVKFALSGSRVISDLSIADDLRQIEADEGQVGQVIHNIVLNADQAMPLGGKIELTARNVSANSPAGRQDDMIEIAIRDQGLGIPQGHLQRIFDPYFTTKEKGSGLGLATSYSIIKNHGGTITVSSELGKGSVFTISLPAAKAAQEPPVPSDPGRAGAPARILVMDDDPVVRSVAVELLTVLGNEVETAENGEAAIESYRRAMDQGKQFDIVILDLTVRGGMGGTEAVQGLLELDPDVNAVVSSGYSDDAAMADYLSLGFKASLKKPYDIEELGELVTSLLS